ncbi:hypothetical protein VFPPC_15363 [Pochonia chlamydosporia 170]|uniref:Uncharacterized protein n=1 Tax=Pochonia chlamydosporia 170 TaxID=1380566 RepID=A0A179G8S4_METCM|nr:hypothetical protein VFPPC_15363 [Pochonia chlamydosporia 170]OAQ73783.1 hypothetical protein VFPPC_15363 [Pochonia chlamydosporia 170]
MVNDSFHSSLFTVLDKNHQVYSSYIQDQLLTPANHVPSQVRIKEVICMPVTKTNTQAGKIEGSRYNYIKMRKQQRSQR